MTSVFFSEIAIAVCGEHVGTPNDGAVCTGFSGAHASQDLWGARMHCNIGIGRTLSVGETGMESTLWFQAWLHGRFW